MRTKFNNHLPLFVEKEAPTIKMDDDKCHTLFRKVFRGLSLAEQCKEEVKKTSRQSHQLKAKSSDFKEAELAEIKEKVHDHEVLGTHLWIRCVYEEKCDIFQDVKEFEKSLQQCTEQLFPALRQECQEVQVAQAIYLDSLKKESSSLKLQLENLKEKVKTLKADIAVLEAEEELTKEAVQELSMQKGYIAGQAKNEQFLKAVEERKKEKILSELEALAEDVKEGCVRFKMLNDGREQCEV
ncbi:uncharacterized protein PF3D7_1120000-like isoform X3 [Macrobrachium rosenbergii]|uniref:uncharacterized protein PF3D7_1120000-like isoform X3 n=1 Tax=Macrobrachium rosenbergii TaxID=79674 RepID=UPI0034D74F08